VSWALLIIITLHQRIDGIFEYYLYTVNQVFNIVDGLISSGNKRTFENFKNQIPKASFALFKDLRDHCLSLGENVVEDVRMHRIVFGKSLTFRWFADLEPLPEGVLVKVQKNRKEQPTTIMIQNNGNAEDLKNLIREAFAEIH